MFHCNGAPAVGRSCSHHSHHPSHPRTPALMKHSTGAGLVSACSSGMHLALQLPSTDALDALKFENTKSVQCDCAAQMWGTGVSCSALQTCGTNSCTCHVVSKTYLDLSFLPLSEVCAAMRSVITVVGLLIKLGLHIFLSWSHISVVGALVVQWKSLPLELSLELLRAHGAKSTKHKQEQVSQSWLPSTVPYATKHKREQQVLGGCAP